MPSMEDAPDRELRQFLARPPFRIRVPTHDMLAPFVEAVTHPSYASEMRQRGRAFEDYQRLEFLGDSLLKNAVCDVLYREGMDTESMNRRKEELVENDHLADILASYSGGTVIRISGPNLANMNAAGISHMRADVAEALCGAVLEVFGYDRAYAVACDMLDLSPGALPEADMDGAEDPGVLYSLPSVFTSDISADCQERMRIALADPSAECRGERGRLAVLGDSVLELTASLAVFRSTNLDEGRMTLYRQDVMSSSHLGPRARSLILTEGSDRVVSESFKALLGALQACHGYERASEAAMAVIPRPVI